MTEQEPRVPAAEPAESAPEPVIVLTAPEDAVEIVDTAADEPRLSLGDHIDELRARLIRVILAIIASFILCFAFYAQIWHFAMLPREQAAELIGKSADVLFPVRTDGPLSGLCMAASLALKCAIALSLPVVFIELWLFIVPGLRLSERRAMQLIISFGSLLFFCGAAVAYFFAAPVGLKFLNDFNLTLPGLVELWSIDNYISFLTMICVGFGLCFELPLAMFALTWAGLISPPGIRRYWRHTLMAIIVVGAAFTPPDPFTMTILSGCLIVLFLIGYGLSELVYRRRQRELSTPEEVDDDLV